MPNDRAKTSILQNIDLKKYPKLGQFLTVQSLSQDKETKVLSNKQALDLLEEAIGEVEDQRSSPAAAPLRASRQKELDQQASAIASDPQTELNEDNQVEKLELVTEKEALSEIEKGTDQQDQEQEHQPESVKPSESAELAEIGQELAEIKEVDQEQEEQELAKKQQATIDQLANQVQNPSAPIKPVVVLPITEQQQKLAKNKNIHFSLRWLAEWADKIKKIFAGAVLYKEEVENSADV